mmetsp:Transcript_14985/g.19753  ORF Transcript_14985/g.19753 Transcript_14985/m.19753 type:complete len:800 (+) Transcript_14985:134-2533(+)
MADWKKDPACLIGKRITVLWGRGKEYKGSVRNYDKSTKTHEVLYDDGDRNQHNMRNKIFWLDNGMEFRPNWYNNPDKWFRTDELKKALYGGCFALSGKLWKSQSDIEEQITQHGGRVNASVTNEVNYLIANDKYMVTEKERRAFQLGIPIVKEDFIFESLYSKELKFFRGQIPDRLICTAKTMKLYAEDSLGEEGNTREDEVICIEHDSEETCSDKEEYEGLTPADMHSKKNSDVFKMKDAEDSVDDELQVLQDDCSDCAILQRKATQLQEENTMLERESQQFKEQFCRLQKDYTKLQKEAQESKDKSKTALTQFQEDYDKLQQETQHFKEHLQKTKEDYIKIQEEHTKLQQKFEQSKDKYQTDITQIRDDHTKLQHKTQLVKEELQNTKESYTKLQDENTKLLQRFEQSNRKYQNEDTEQQQEDHTVRKQSQDNSCNLEQGTVQINDENEKLCQEILCLKEFLKERKLEQEFERHMMAKKSILQRLTINIPNQPDFPLAFEQINGQLILKDIKDFASQDCKSLMQKGDILRTINNLKVTSIRMLRMACDMLVTAETLELYIERCCDPHKKNNRKRAREEKTVTALLVHIKNQTPLGIIVGTTHGNVEIKDFDTEATEEIKTALRIGDILCAINGLKVDSEEDFTLASEMLCNMDKLSLSIQRRQGENHNEDSEQNSIKRARQNQKKIHKKFEVEIKNQQPLGIAVATENGQLFIKDFCNGATLEMKSKLKIGDIISEINGLKVSSQSMLKMAMEMLSIQDVLKFSIERTMVPDCNETSIMVSNNSAVASDEENNSGPA